MSTPVKFPKMPDYFSMYKQQATDQRVKLLEEWFSFFMVELEKAYQALNELEEEKAKAQDEHIKIVDDLLASSDHFIPDIQSITFEVDQDIFVNDWSVWFDQAGMTIINFFVFDVEKEKNYTLEPSDKRIIVYFIAHEHWVTEFINLMKGGARC